MLGRPGEGTRAYVFGGDAPARRPRRPREPALSEAEGGWRAKLAIYNDIAIKAAIPITYITFGPYLRLPPVLT